MCLGPWPTKTLVVYQAQQPTHPPKKADTCTFPKSGENQTNPPPPPPAWLEPVTKRWPVPNPCRLGTCKTGDKSKWLHTACRLMVLKNSQRNPFFLSVGLCATPATSVGGTVTVLRSNPGIRCIWGLMQSNPHRMSVLASGLHHRKSASKSTPSSTAGHKGGLLKRTDVHHRLSYIQSSTRAGARNAKAGSSHLTKKLQKWITNGPIHVSNWKGGGPYLQTERGHHSTQTGTLCSRLPTPPQCTTSLENLDIEKATLERGQT